MPDNYSLWEDKTRREEAWLARRPVCSHCGEHIQGRRLFDIDGELWHRSCFIEEFEKETEDYIA